MVSVDELLIKLQSPELGTDEFQTTINTLLSVKKEITKSPSLGLKLASIMLTVLCDDSKWMLMNKDLKNSASQLLASDIGLSYLVNRLKLGFEKLSSASAREDLSSSMEVSLHLAGTYVNKKRPGKNASNTSGEIKTELNVSPAFTIKPKESSAHFTNSDKDQNTQIAPLSLQITKPIIIIQFDILLWIIDHHLQPLVCGFYERKHASFESSKSFKSLLSSKVPSTLGNALVFTLDDPKGLTVGKLSISRDKIKKAIDIYASTLLSVMLAVNDNIPNMLSFEVICELWKHDSAVFDLLLSNWIDFVKLVPNLSSSLRAAKVEIDLFKYITTRLFQSIDKQINSSNFKNYYAVVDSWILKLQSSGIKRKIICDLVYNLCEISVSQFSIFTWLTAIKYSDLKWVMEALSKFGSKEYISTTPLKAQKQLTMLIIFLIEQLKASQVNEISANPLFLNSITVHLESNQDAIRVLGIVVADQIYEIENKKPLFSIQKYKDQRSDFLSLLYSFRKFESDGMRKDVQSATKELLKKENEESLLPTLQAITESEKPLIMEIDYNSDADDSDAEDTSVPRKPRVAKPVYLKDLLAYLTCDNEKDNKAYYKKGVAFSIGIEMIRIKANTSELTYYSKNLIDSASNITDFGFPDLPKKGLSETSRMEAFNIWKMSFMIAIIVSSPAVSIDYLLKCFLQNDIATPHRVQILSAIGFACRELCDQGNSDTFIWGKDSEQKVAPKQLDGPGHNQFMKLDFQAAENSESRGNKIIQVSDDNNIRIGTVTRRSKKLEIDERDSKSSQEIQLKKKVTTYINKGLPNLLYALTSIWHEVSSQTGGKGFNVGSMSEILNAHYLSIVAMVYTCGVPSCIELIEMSKELLTIAREQLSYIEVTRHDLFPHLLFSGVIKCVGSVVVENDSAMNILIHEMPLELVEIMGLITSIMNEQGETLSDIITLSKAAKLVLKLQELLKIY